MSAHNPIKRRPTKKIHVGNVAIGGDAPISVQSMTNTNTCDVAATVAELCQILARRWANAVDVTAGPRRESLSQAAKRWADLAREFGSAGATGYAYALERREVSSSGEYG